MATTTDTRVMRVAILTPYLSENIGEMGDESFVSEQMQKYGYDPKNFDGEKSILTRNGNLVLLAKPSYIGVGRRRLGAENIRGAELIIAGSTEPGEEEVLSFKGTGIPVARYSIFYGGESGYTGRTPEEGGYALDIPKNVSTVRTLLSSDGFLEAILERDEAKVRNALEATNKELDTPILATPYLTEVFRN